jgi:hypothetical protein
MSASTSRYTIEGNRATEQAPNFDGVETEPVNTVSTTSTFWRNCLSSIVAATGGMDP